MSRTGPWMQTASGGQFFILDPRPEEIHLRDIAAALSKCCRYGGHTTRFYSVAEHCVLMARAAPKPFKKWALLHDASEAYLGDVIRPLKAHLTNYRDIEERVMRAVATRFDLPWPMPPEVKVLDNRILVDELTQIMAPPPADWRLESWDPLGVTIKGWTPAQAEFAFMLEGL